MTEKPDIESREDIEHIMRRFYDKLLSDDTINYYFDEIIQDNRLEHHFGILTDFWENILFYSGTYQRNAMAPHLKLHASRPFEATHFDCWLGHLNQTIDEFHSGPNAHNMKTRALSIATVMKLKTKVY